MKKKIYFWACLVLVVGMIYVGFLQYKISQYGSLEAPGNADYLIVLGARVKGDVPSLVLKERIDAAAAYLLINHNTVAIASGGLGPGETISEAEAIKKRLVAKGVEESRIILEKRSTDTYENIRFSKMLIPSGLQSGIIVTNTFHMYRSLMIARDEDLKVAGLPAKTPLSAIFKSYSREYMAITKYYLKKIF
jgi:uncharacterized SAM-binding protein YcdF (DUF218 family)